RCQETNHCKAMQLTAIKRFAKCRDGSLKLFSRVMKLTAIFLFMLCMQVSAKSEGQVISISVKNSSLEKVMGEIEKQSGYSFIYGKELIGKAGAVSVEIKNASL